MTQRASTLLGFVLCTTAFAQATVENDLSVYDGTTQAASRGAVGTNAKILLQRYTSDQICGARKLLTIKATVQDQNAATAETFNFDVRTNDPAMPGTPNLAAAGLLATGLFTNVAFGASGVVAVQITVTMAAGGLVLPTTPAGISAGDLYVGLNSAAQPLWTADGVSMQCSGAFPPSPGEQMRATALGYTATIGVAGLGWDCTPATNSKVLGSGNRAWNITLGWSQDVAQAFATNGTVFTGGNNGLNPNFGYAGLFPDMLRGDGVGVRLRSSATIGSMVWVGTDLVSAAPLVITGVDGALCLNPSTLALLPTPFLTAPPAAGSLNVSEFVLGPFAAGTYAGLGSVYVQFFTVDPNSGAQRLSTLARVNL